MTIYCPNYRCHLQQNAAKICTNCGTALDIYGSSNGQSIIYQLTKILQDSSGKIRDDGEYCWYELFQAEANGANFVIKMLIIVPDRLSPSNDKHISKVKTRFQREYDLLCKGLEGVCKGYEILDIPVGTEMVRSIVMEEVSGLNLEEYVEQNRPIDSQRAIRWMKQLLVTIDNMHKNQVQHRDIKPSNIMVSGGGLEEKLTLIDFGIALDTSNDQTTQQIGLGTDVYKDPLTSDKYRDDSDLYSLGKTFVRLLTGQRPPYEDNWHWFDDNNIIHPKVDQRLKKVIERMVSGDQTKRSKSANALLKYVEGRNQPKWLLFMLFVLTGLATSLLFFLPNPKSKTPTAKYIHPVCGISEIKCGQDTPPSIAIKKQGLKNAFLNLNDSDQVNRTKAVEIYKDIWNSFRDDEANGELLIYLNNAEIQKKAYQDKSQEIYTLMVSVPAYNKPPGATRDLLGGVAQAQKYFNTRSDKIKLYVAILQEPVETANDNNETIKSLISQVIEKSSKTEISDNNSSKKQQDASESKLIGVIGHYSSQVTFSVLKTYADRKVMLVSPSATRADIPDQKTTEKDLKYFARLISNGRGQVHEISNLLNYLAHEKPHCGFMSINLIYQEDDTYSNSVGVELSKLFMLNGALTNKKVRLQSEPYKLKGSTVENESKKIITWLKEDLKISNGLKIGNCTPRQMVIFIPGAHVTSDQRQIVKSIAENLPSNADFIGNIVVNDVLSDVNFQKSLGVNFYKKAYIIAPYNVLDFLPSYLLADKSIINQDFLKEMINDSKKQNEVEDILNIQWRKLSSADAVFVFIEALKVYSSNPSKYKSQTTTEAIHSIIKNENFSAEGIFGNIQFTGHERKGIKTGTILRYVPHQISSKGMVAVPLDYRDKNDPMKDIDKYQIIKADDFSPQKANTKNIPVPPKPTD